MKTKILLWNLVLLILSVGAVATTNLSEDIYSCWELDNVTDYYGNGNLVVEDGAPTITTEDGYNAIYFDGNDGYQLGTGNYILDHDKEDYTHCTLIKSNGGFGTFTASYIEPINMDLASSTGLIYFTYNDGVAWLDHTSSTDGNDNDWHHVCFTRYSNDTNYFYIDGNLDHVEQYSLRTDVECEQYFGGNCVSASCSTLNNYYTGYMAKPMIWKRGLNSSEIETLYNNIDTVNCSLLISDSATNFTITAENNYGETINVFNATISGTTYSTSNGTIITDILDNSTSLFNITVEALNHDDRTYLNYNVSSDLAAVLNFSYYKLNTTVSLYNGSTINNFNITVSSTEYTTTNGFITLNLTKDAVYEILVNPTGYTINTSNVTVNEWITNHSVTVWPTNTLNVSFYDEETNTLLTLNVSYSLIVDDLNATSGTTVTGNAWTENLAAGSYEIRYSATDYDERSYFFTLTDRNYYELSLYLINNTLVEDITNVLRDEYGNLLENYIIKLLRYYPALSAYLVVDEGKTNFAGETILQAVRNNYYYKFRITDSNGTVIKTTGSTQIYDTTINHYVTLGAGVGTALERLGDLSYSLAFLNATDTFRFVFDHASGTVVSASLYVYEIDATGLTLINSSTLASGSGTIYVGLTPTNETSYISKAYVTYSGDSEETYVDSLTYTNDDILNIFGQYGVFLTLIICLILVFIGRFNPSVAVILLPVALIITRIAHLHVLAWTHITAITALGFVVIYAIHKIS